MNDQHIWRFALQKIQAQHSCTLIVIVERQGSAANTVGAKAMVCSDGEFTGTVGGGITEFTLVEQAKKIPLVPELVSFHHDENAPQNRSGAICSGSQTFALVALTHRDENLLEILSQPHPSQADHCLVVSADRGLELCQIEKEKIPPSFSRSNTGWEYREPLTPSNTVTMIGGGHISLALSRVLSHLDFRITVLDNRENLTTFKQNSFAHHKMIVPYTEIETLIPEGEHSYVTIMTYGHKTDEFVLERLLQKNFKYLGLLGSEQKVKKVFARLQIKGISPELFQKVYAPIGIPINSDTPEEIAISIAAEIIGVSKNSAL